MQVAPAPCGGGTGRWRNSCPPSFWPRVTHYTERPPCCEVLGAPGGREGQCPGRRGGDTGPGRGAGMGAFPPVSGAVPLRVGTPPGPCWGDDEKAVSPHEAVRPRSSEPCACGRACGWGAGRVSAERWRFRAPRGLRESARDWPRRVRVRGAPLSARPSEDQRSHGVRPTSGACGRGPWLHGCRAPPPDTVKARAAPSCAQRAAAGGGGGDGARASAFPCWPPREGLQREAAQPGLGAPGRAAASRQPGIPGAGSLPGPSSPPCPGTSHSNAPAPGQRPTRSQGIQPITDCPCMLPASHECPRPAPAPRGLAAIAGSARALATATTHERRDRPSLGSPRPPVAFPLLSSV